MSAVVGSRTRVWTLASLQGVLPLLCALTPSGLVAQSEVSLRYGLADYDFRDVVENVALGPDSSLTVTRLAGSGTRALGAEFMGFLDADEKLYGSFAVYYGSSTAMGNADFTYKYAAELPTGDTTFKAQAANIEYWNLKIGIGYQLNTPESGFFFRPEVGMDWESGKMVLFDEAVSYFVEDGFIKYSGITANRSLLIGAYFRLVTGLAIGGSQRVRLLVSPGLKWATRLDDNNTSDYFTSEPSRVSFDATAGFSIRLDQ